MFQLTTAEAESSRSQIATLNAARGRNIKYRPYAFTEHGAIQAANILNSARAIAMGVFVVRAFIQLRELLSANKVLARHIGQLKARIEKKLATHDEAITTLFSVIRKLVDPPMRKHRGIGFTADLGAG